VHWPAVAALRSERQGDPMTVLACTGERNRKEGDDLG
jgi:hypothetical protein